MKALKCNPKALLSIVSMQTTAACNLYGEAGMPNAGSSSMLWGGIESMANS